MRFRIIAMGRPGEEWIREGLSHYIKLLSKYAAPELVILKPQKIRAESQKQSILKKEAELIEASWNRDNYRVVLDQHGRQLSSLEFAEMLEWQFQHGRSTIEFIIGSPLGLAEEVKAQADLLLSLSDLTLPHELALLLLAEQIYRALTILKGGKYHK